MHLCCDSVFVSLFAQVQAGVERVKEILLQEDKDMVISMSQDAFSYIDVMPEMVGYVLGSRCVGTVFLMCTLFDASDASRALCFMRLPRLLCV